MDVRLDDDGKPHVLEVNPSCYLKRGEVFADAAQRAGHSYEALIRRTVELAAGRNAR